MYTTKALENLKHRVAVVATRDWKRIELGGKIVELRVRASTR